jgi:hypothetical protein
MGKPGQLSFTMGACPMHGADCTVFSFSTQDGALGNMIHLNEAGLRAVHRHFGQRLLEVGVPRVIDLASAGG